MTRYNVHLFREMRLYYQGIEAEGPAEAAKTASGMDSGEAEGIEDCNGVNLGALVDAEGAAAFRRSELIDFESQRMIQCGPKLLEALDYLLQQTVDQDLNYGIALSEGEQDARTRALAVIAKVTGGAPPEPRKPIVIEVRGGIVQDVLHVPPGIEYVIRDYDAPEEAGEEGRSA